MDCLPPDRKPQFADVCSKEFSSTGLNSVDIFIAQIPKKTEQQTQSKEKSATGFDQLPLSKQKTVEDDYNKKHKGEIPIGDATMDKSETINVRIRSMGGMNADAMISYKKGSEHYDSVLKHIGGMKPGEVKLVAPFPDEKTNPKNVTPKTKTGGG